MERKQFFKLDITKPDNSDINAWADFVEISCLLHPDQIFTFDALSDESEDASRAGVEKGLEDDADTERDILPEIPEDLHDFLPSSAADIYVSELIEHKLRSTFQRLEVRALIFRNAYPFELVKGKFLKTRSKLDIVHYFYIILLLSANLRIATPSGVNRIGNLFEKLCGPFFRLLVPVASECHHFGAAADSGELFAGGLKQKIEQFCTILETRISLKAQEGIPNSGDGGLDWIAYHKFSDTAWQVPVFFAQCACGADWINKQDEAGRQEWEALVDLPFPIMTYLFTPRSPRSGDNNGFENAFNIRNELVLIDRQRLLELAQRDEESMKKSKRLFQLVLDEFVKIKSKI